MAHHSGYTTLCQLGIQCVFFGLQFLCLCSGIDVVGDDSENNNQGDDEKTTENISGNNTALPVTQSRHSGVNAECDQRQHHADMDPLLVFVGVDKFFYKTDQ